MVNTFCTSKLNVFIVNGCLQYLLVLAQSWVYNVSQWSELGLVPASNVPAQEKQGQIMDGGKKIKSELKEMDMNMLILHSVCSLDMQALTNMACPAAAKQTVRGDDPGCNQVSYQT